jgi:hypothetical protein
MGRMRTGGRQDLFALRKAVSSYTKQDGCQVAVGISGGRSVSAHRFSPLRIAASCLATYRSVLSLSEIFAPLWE